MKAKEKTYCINCGGISHCRRTLRRKESETINNKIVREWTIEVCRSCECDRCGKKNEN
jgi:hypothetical protein